MNTFLKFVIIFTILVLILSFGSMIRKMDNKHFPEYTLQYVPRNCTNAPVIQNILAVNMIKSYRPELNILFLVPYETFDSIMDRFYFQIYEAVSRHPQMNAFLWGPGFPDFNKDSSLSENLSKKFTDIEFNVVWYGREDMEWQYQLPTDAISTRIFHEAVHQQGGEQLIFWRQDSFHHLPMNVTFFTYANDMVFYANHSVNRLFVHLPHGAPRGIFYGSVDNPNLHTKERPTDVILTGFLDPNFYPLRKRIANLIQEGRIPGKVLKHPGYTEMKTEEEKKEMGINRTFLEQQIKNYADELASSKIVVCTRSTRGYSLRKYIEAAMAGALVIGNIPESDRSDEFRSYVVEINSDMSDDEIVATVKWWLNHPKQRLERAKLGQDIVIGKYTWDVLSDQIYQSWVDYLYFGVRGMKFPHHFNIDVQRPYGPLKTKE